MDSLAADTTLGHIAAHTKQARLGTMVTGVTYRHPGILAKQVTTLDVLSGGRAYLGIGAAWLAREHVGLGVPFPRLQNVFNDWRKRCKSPNKCGAPTTVLTKGDTIALQKR